MKDAVEPSKGDYLSLRTRDGEIKSFPVGKVSTFKGNFVVKGLHPSSIKDLPDDVSVYLMNHDFQSDRKDVRKTHIEITFDSSETGVIRAFARVTEGPLQEITAEDELTYEVTEGRGVINASRIEEQLRKTGSTAFTVDNVYLSGAENAFCSVKDINELRRGVLEMLSSEVLSETSHIAVEEFFIGDSVAPSSSTEGTVKTLRYYPLISSDTEVKYADIYAFSAYDYLVENKRIKIDEIISNTGSELMLVRPDFAHDDQSLKFDSLSDIRFMPTAGLNIYNTESLKHYLKLNGEAFISYEKSPDEALDMLRKASASGDIYLHAGGFIPWMQSDFCPVGRNAAGCSACKGRGAFTMKQEEGPDVKVVTHPSDCTSTLYGPAKYIFDDAACMKAAGLGYNVIKCYTEV